MKRYWYTNDHRNWLVSDNKLCLPGSIEYFCTKKKINNLINKINKIKTK